MDRRTRSLVALLAAVVALGMAAAPAAIASNTQETVLQDDSLLIYSAPKVVAGTLLMLKGLGVDRVRVSVVWSLVAPDPESEQRPSFDATDPAAYPPGSWQRYDTLVQMARAIGIKLYFQLTAPAPVWATPPPELPQGYRFSHDPSAPEFGEFAEAVGRRYLGAVNYWGIWNEPNIGGWMTPQWRTLRNGRKVEASPEIYRNMVDAAWQGLQRSGHSRDTILIGETGAYGFGWKGYGADMGPLTFVRALYCVNSRYRPLKGRTARNIGCPRSGSRRAFRATHPGLFHATGWAHHPYDFHHAPAFHLRDPGAADLADLGRLERALDRARGAYRVRARLPLYLTEWGYQSNPPDPFVKFTQAQQADYLNQGEYMAWRDRRIRSFAQFLLVDSLPFTQYPNGSRAYWSSFQTGLLDLNFKQKLSFAAFRLPLWLPRARHGKHVAAWGHLRPADHAQAQSAQLEFQPSGSGSWRSIDTVRTKNSEGYFLVHVRIPSRGAVRLVWHDPASGSDDVSRTVSVR